MVVKKYITSISYANLMQPIIYAAFSLGSAPITLSVWHLLSKQITFHHAAVNSSLQHEYQMRGGKAFLHNWNTKLENIGYIPPGKFPAWALLQWEWGVPVWVSGCGWVGVKLLSRIKVVFLEISVLRAPYEVVIHENIVDQGHHTGHDILSNHWMVLLNSRWDEVLILHLWSTYNYVPLKP